MTSSLIFTKSARSVKPIRLGSEAELRVAFSRTGTVSKLLQRELALGGVSRGSSPSRVRRTLGVFTEVKSPGWEGELTPKELKAGRQHQPKDLDRDGRAVAPWERVQFEIGKAYKKFDPQNRNLLILA